MNKKDFTRITSLKKVGISDKLIIEMLMQKELKPVEGVSFYDRISAVAHMIDKYYKEVGDEQS